MNHAQIDKLFEDLKTTELHCDRHGSYTLLGHATSDVCPKCEKEQVEQKERQERASALLREAGLKTARQLEARIENWVVRNEIQAKVKSEVEQYDFRKNLLMLGNVGTGKTHLASALIRKACEHLKSARYLKLYEFMNEIKRSFAYNSQMTSADIIDKYSDYDFLVIDEFSALNSGQEIIEFVADLIDRRYGNYKPTCIISNLTMEEFLSKTDKSIVSRIMSCSSCLNFIFQDYRQNFSQF